MYLQLQRLISRHEKIKDDDLHIDNYCIAMHDRHNSDNNWGGSLIYFREEIDGFERL